MAFNLSFKVQETVTENIEFARQKLSPRHLTYINRHIVARVIHAETVQNFYKEGRPKWEDLSRVYKKIKNNTVNITKAPNRQPQELGRYPTVWNKIGVRYGALFGSLGTVLQISANRVIYGTDVSYAKNFAEGHYVKRIHATARNGRKYYVNLKNPVWVPGRPFYYMSRKAKNAIGDSIVQYVSAEKGRKRILIPDIGYPILGSGGRYVPIAYT